MNILEICQKLIPGNVYSFDTNIMYVRDGRFTGESDRRFISTVKFKELVQTQGGQYFVIFQRSQQADSEAINIDGISRVLGDLQGDEPLPGRPWIAAE